MKKSNQPMQLVLMLFAVFMIASCNSKNSKYESFNADLRFRTIVLQVNTAEIKPGSNTEQYVSFANQPQGVSDKEFLTNVSLGDSIVWMGISTSNPFMHKVIINQINHHGQDNVLDQNTIRAQDGKVLGIVKKTGLKGETEKYTIHFIIDKGGNGQGPTYLIDPKLKLMK